MKFNVYFDMVGPAGTVVNVPNNSNPVECTNLASLLASLAQNLPSPFGTECIGVKVESIDEKELQGSVR